MLSLLILLLLLTINGLIVTVVFLSNPRNKINQYFGALMFFLMAWILSSYLENEPAAGGLRPFLLRLDFASAIILGLFFYIFCINFPKVLAITRRKKIFIFLPAIAIALMSFTDLIITDIHFQQNTIQFRGGPLFLVYFFTLAFYMFVGCANLALKYRKAVGVEKTQLLYILLGFFISAAIAFIIFQILTPLMFIPLDVARIGVYGTLVFCVSSAIAITKYHLFSIRLILTELFVALIGILIFILIFSMPTSSLRAITAASFLLFCFFGYYLIKATREESERREKAEQAVEQERILREKAEVIASELKKLDEAKSQFMFSTQHHLRGPLTVVQGYLSMFYEGSYGKITKKQKEKIKSALEASQKMIKIVNQFLDMAQYQIGAGSSLKQETDIILIMDEIIEDLLPEAKEKGLYFEYEKPEEALPTLALDGIRLKEALYNIADNALKYTESGGVKVKIIVEADVIQIKVADTGIGLNKEEKEKLFSKSFERGKKAQQIHADGKGIGLFLAAQIVTSQRGKIWAESSGHGRGSVFCVELPLDPERKVANKSLNVNK